MNKIKLNSRSSRSAITGQLGMTLLESLVATIMLVVFTGVVALVMQFTLRFFNVAESGDRNEFDVSNGVLIDQMELRATMQRLVSLLEQPGISRGLMLGLDDKDRSAIAHPQTVNPDQACVLDPIRAWNLPLPTGSVPSLPPGYRLCVWTTSIQEATTQQLLTGGLSPGVYVMQALPEQLTTSHLPSRLLFCRPKPFC